MNTAFYYLDPIDRFELCAGVYDDCDDWGADMFVVICVLNACSGFAFVAERFMLDNSLLTTVDRSLDSCIAMNRSLPNVLSGGIGAPAAPAEHKIEGTITKTTIEDTVHAPVAERMPGQCNMLLAEAAVL
ncbi:hypothetical protein C8J56DRAFT_895740 [Mycena floridula]|nr:hypothetical protein C8J56DRAFT_895740 [Mycena floridula]